MVSLPLKDDNHYERNRPTQHNSSHDEQNDPQLSNRKDPAIERKTRIRTASAIQTRSHSLVDPTWKAC